MLSIGPLTVASSLVLAPMAGISDLPFRLLNRSFGCELAFTEMISANALVRANKNTLKMLFTNSDDRPLGIQLLGNDPEVIKRAMDILSEEYAFDSIDLNVACPVNKVVSCGEGASLLREPVKVQKLLKALVSSTDMPVTVKIRSGWDGTSVNAVEIGLAAQDAGIAGLFIHGRTRSQGYRGKVDYTIIRKVKESLGIPVIGSGDALTPDLIKKMFDETECDGVAVARGAFGNPWIFRQTTAYLQSGTAPVRPGPSEIAETMKAHLDLLIAFRGEDTGVILFRKFYAWYSRGMPAKRLRQQAFQATARDEMLYLIGALQASMTV
jgi:tRNA-dihydrouridine synthase B